MFFLAFAFSFSSVVPLLLQFRVPKPESLTVMISYVYPPPPFSCNLVCAFYTREFLRRFSLFLSSLAPTPFPRLPSPTFPLPSPYSPHGTTTQHSSAFYFSHVPWGLLPGEREEVEGGGRWDLQGKEEKERERKESWIEQIKIQERRRRAKRGEERRARTALLTHTQKGRGSGVAASPLPKETSRRGATGGHNVAEKWLSKHYIKQKRKAISWKMDA